MHRSQIKKVRSEGTWDAAQLETIVHPNEYFKRSYLLKQIGKTSTEDIEKVED